MTGRSFVQSLLIILLVGPAACSKTLTVEQQIIASIRIMEEKIDAGERRPFLQHIAEDFTGQGGAITKEQLRTLLIFQLNRHKRMQTQLFPIHVTQSSELTAVATFKALVTGGPKRIPDSGQLFSFETHWRLDGDEWYLHAANWTPGVFDNL